MNPYFIFEADRVHDRPEIVVAVRPRIQNTQREVDFCGGKDGSAGGLGSRWSRCALSHDLLL